MNINLNTKFHNKVYKFNFLLGYLIAKKIKKENSDKIKNNFNSNEKLSESLRIIENPFLAKIQFHSNKNNFNVPKIIKLYAKLLIWFQKHFYIGLYLLSKLRLGIYDNTFIATETFCHIYQKDQNKLCLPRSIFAMTTSKSFKESGVLFIGVFHPSRHMHAWIIENGRNTFIYDNIWINFMPVGVII